MINTRAVVIAALGITFFGPTLSAFDLSRYRSFELGSDLASVAELTTVPPTEATTVHQRPALLQNLEWRPSAWLGGAARSTDPVRQMIFGFYNDQLFQIAVDYDPDLTEGMTNADMIESISVIYGAALRTRSGPAGAASAVDNESNSVVARWGDAAYAVALYRTSLYRSDFRLIVTDKALNVLAQKAATQAVRLDEQEAPSRAIADQKKQQEDSRAAAEKARATNKNGFRP